MADFDLILTGDWPKYTQAIDPRKFKSRIKPQVRAATEQNAMFVRLMVRKSIRKSWVKNAPLTVLIKKSQKTLVDYGELFQAITYKMIDWDSAFVGVLKQAKSKAGSNLANVAYTIHEGATITVTNRMRILFIYLAMATQGKIAESALRGRAKAIYERVQQRRIIKPLHPGTTAIRIPKRPFISKVFENRLVRSQVKKRWIEAIDKALVP